MVKRTQDIRIPLYIRKREPDFSPELAQKAISTLTHQKLPRKNFNIFGKDNRQSSQKQNKLKSAHAKNSHAYQYTDSPTYQKGNTAGINL
jgi:hypothetical protein